MCRFVQRTPTFFGISRTQVDTAVLSYSCEPEDLPGHDCNRYFNWYFGKYISQPFTWIYILSFAGFYKKMQNLAENGHQFLSKADSSSY